MSDDQFTRLFKYMQREFSTIRAELDDVKADVRRVYDLVDKNVKQHETDEQERLLMNHQLERHERWHSQTAKHIGIKLGQ